MALIIIALWQIPYDILREERFRVYGETRTAGVVTETHTVVAENGKRRYLIEYKYVDQDGFARTATAPLPDDLWKQYRPGSRIDVLYIRSKPGMSRIIGEIEPVFQVWLRRMLD